MNGQPATAPMMLTSVVLVPGTPPAPPINLNSLSKEQLIEKIRELENRISSLREEVSELKAELDKREVIIQSQDQTITDLVCQFEEVRDLISKILEKPSLKETKTYQGLMNALSEILHFGKMTESVKDIELAHVKAERDALAAQVREAQIKQGMDSRLLDLLKAKITFLNAELEKRNTALKQTEGLCEAMDATQKHAAEGLAIFKSETERVKAELQKEINKLQGELKSAIAQRDEAKRVKETQRQQRDELKAKLASLKRNFQVHLAKIQAEKEAYKEALSRLKQEVQKQNVAMLAEFQNAIRMLTAKANEALARATDTALEASVAGLQIQLELANGRTDAAEARAQAAEERAASLEAQLASRPEAQILPEMQSMKQAIKEQAADFRAQQAALLCVLNSLRPPQPQSFFPAAPPGYYYPHYQAMAPFAGSMMPGIPIQQIPMPPGAGAPAPGPM